MPWEAGATDQILKQMTLLVSWEVDLCDLYWRGEVGGWQQQQWVKDTQNTLFIQQQHTYTPRHLPLMHATSGHIIPGLAVLFKWRRKICQGISVYFRCDAGGKDSQGLPVNCAFNADFPKWLPGSAMARKEKLLPWYDNKILSLRIALEWET